MIHASILTILAITSERFYVICYPLKNTLKFQQQAVLKIIIVIWCIAIATSIPFVVMTFQEDAEFYDGTPCKVCRTKMEDIWHYSYLLGTICVFLITPFFLLVIMYVMIIKCLVTDRSSILCKKNPSSIYNMRTRRQVVRMLIGIIILFFVSMVPLRVVTLWMVFSRSEDIQALGLEGFLNLLAFSRAMLYLNSAGNPVIYSIMSTKFKLAFRRLWGNYNPLNGHRLYKTQTVVKETQSVAKEHDHVTMVKRWMCNDVNKDDSCSSKTSASDQKSKKYCIEITFHSA